MALPSTAILWGATGQARVLREILEHASVGVAALFDNNPEATSPLAGVPIFHGREGFALWEAQLPPERLVGFLVAIGGEHGADRLQIQDWLGDRGLVPLRATHPTAVVLTDSIGAGTQLLASSTLCVDVQVGRAVIVNTGATVDHECVLEDGVHIAPGANLAGLVSVGRCAMVGIGAIVLPRVRIGEGAVVGAGAVVLHDVPPYTVVAGNPAKIIGSRRLNRSK